MSLRLRFEEKIAKTSEGCWLWMGHIDPAGYARLKADGKYGAVLYAHRLSYEIHVAPIPGGLTIDHLCRVRHCVNPSHLEAVTKRENILRGESPSAIASRRVTCPAGHPYDFVTRAGHRRCKVCDNATQRRYRATRKELVG